MQWVISVVEWVGGIYMVAHTQIKLDYMHGRWLNKYGVTWIDPVLFSVNLGNWSNQPKCIC